MVPFIDLTRFEGDLLSRWTETVHDMSSRAQFVGGPQVQAFEDYLKEYLNTGYAVSCANGTDALQLALRAVGVGADDAVIIPNATFWATFEAVVNVGARPICVDIDLDDGAMNFDALCTAITDTQPKAVLIAHLFGWCSKDLAKVRAHCRGLNIPLIEDGAQCYGTLLNGESIYKGADIATISFYPAKVMGAAGDAGAVVTTNADYAEKARMLSNHGRTQHYDHGIVGWNSRMDALQAAFLNIAKDYLADRLESRRNTAEIYRQELGHLCNVLSPPPAVQENGYCNVCMIPDAQQKAQVQAALKSEGIGFANIYPGPMTAQTGASEHLGKVYQCANAYAWSAQVLNLPLFPYMTDAEIEAVVNTVKGAYS